MQRIESMRRSPIFSHLSSSLSGIVLIRAFHAEKLLIAEFDRVLNFHTSSYFTKLALQSWFSSTTKWITWGNLMIMTNNAVDIRNIISMYLFIGQGFLTCCVCTLLFYGDGEQSDEYGKQKLIYF